MGILDKIFGSSDPIKTKVNKTVEEDKVETTADKDLIYDKESDNWPPYNILYGKEKWPYDMDPVDLICFQGERYRRKQTMVKPLWAKKLEI